MPIRRVLSLWFPRMAAERQLRGFRGLLDAPFAVVGDRGGMQVLASLTRAAEAEGLRTGQPLRDAQAMCPALMTRSESPHIDAAFLTALRRWAGKFSPWVAEEPPASLVIDLTGCAHLFGGEAALIDHVALDCADLGLSVQAGVADTLGAAWALARYAGQPGTALRSGDAIDQEAYATRSRAAKRRNWERGGAAPSAGAPKAHVTRIAQPGQTRQAIGPLPVAALRIEDEAAAALARLGLRRIEDLWGMPRAALARRVGQGVVKRLDQALGLDPEPVSPARPEMSLAVRLTLPEPIGLEQDILAGIDRLLPELEKRLVAKGHGARRVRMQCFRADQGVEAVEIGLARPSARPDRIRPLLAMKVGGIDAGFGIDAIRIEAVATEPVHDRQHRGHLDAARDVAERLEANTGLDDLIGRVGARIGMEAITRLHPADSHIPEKTQKVLAAAWSDPATDWAPPPTPRPLLMWRPEPVTAEDRPAMPAAFRWRRRMFETAQARGPERIAPEWWLDEPEWRSGVRDYWDVVTTDGQRLWLYYAHGGTMSSGWFCQGRFA
ncbi:Y-family DNA polymerase [Anianabacter salinae]|uniref:Y-family DNA polymerase n=1 Tax=Anianabacter salinae TaxID=2851023 RepID=UPI00225E6396|nr:DNA polymerase Y family protein [Anianabacter salinae]MBV0913715.1 DNA polymerase Y family protein [Anianabacter salinae]